jgi:hypothetical protein
MRMRSSIFSWASVLAVVLMELGCSGSSARVASGADGGPDAGSDGPQGRPPGFVCPVVAAGEIRALGACCVADGDCAGGVCWNGFCTRTCTGPLDCGQVAAPSPLPAGTLMTCTPNHLGDRFSYCLPGSRTVCEPGGVACARGEACALALDGTADLLPATTSAYVGLCLTQLVADTYLPVGSPCVGESPYSCENQGGYLGNGCLQGRCTRACTSSQECPVGMVCGPPPFSTTLGGAARSPASPSAGVPAHVDVGVCQGRACGLVVGDVGGVAMLGQPDQQGADANCITGDVCAATQAVGASGDTQLLSCVPPLPAARPYGASCSTDPAQAMRCADDSLCVTREGANFCSQLCRSDKDCAVGSVCLDGYPSPTLPNGSIARLSMCTPRSTIAASSCHGERDCPVGTACAPIGLHSSFLTCQSTTGTKNVGQNCSADGECRSGLCVDRDANPPGGNRTSCAGYCGKNSDCGAGQICLRRVTSNNGTIDDPRDDVALGFCTTLDAPAPGGASATDDNCTGQTNVDEIGGDTCDTAHATCFTRLGRIGDACAHRADCPLGAYCHLGDPNFEGGVCLSLGCDPAAVVGVDACGPGAICVQRAIDAPLFGCYEACEVGKSCRRAAEQYFCQPAATGQSATICLTPGGP